MLVLFIYHNAYFEIAILSESVKILSLHLHCHNGRHYIPLLNIYLSGIQFCLLLSPYLCFISLLYLDLYVL